jgi:hypothetical protein
MVGRRLNNPLFISGGVQGLDREEVDQYGDYHLMNSIPQRRKAIRDDFVAMAESAAEGTGWFVCNLVVSMSADRILSSESAYVR